MDNSTGVKSEVERLPDFQCRLRIEVPPEEVNRCFEGVYRKFLRNAKIPGFRQGKVPLNILKIRFAATIAEEVMKEIVNKHYWEVLREKEITALSNPKIDADNKLPEENKLFFFVATVEALSEIKLPDYRGITLKKEKVEVTEQDIEAALRMKQEEKANFLAVENRPVKEGDWLLVEITSFVNDSPYQQAKEYLFQLGQNRLPKEVEKSLIGRKVGEESKVEIAHKDGGEVAYKVLVRGIKERRLVVVDDNFARDLGGFASLDELRGHLRKELTLQASLIAERKLREMAIDLIAEQTEVELPPRLIEEQINHLLLYARARSDTDEEYKGEEAMRIELRPTAIHQLKRKLVLEEISRREKITITDEEVKKQQQVRVKLGAKEVGEEKEDELKWQLQRQKTIEFIMSHAKIEEKEKSLVLTPEEAKQLDLSERQGANLGAKGIELVGGK
ncbi:trigger factor [candidate division NPL-UPA2 bacterium Unc8]|uniref:Trigger factor n=1 Tax=candidate division NPL-UPA2 bacterium Unc8 TaxID=1980939 RepID=A0A399FUN6_UNCN2|nr:Trigger factor [Bacillota bacterium]MBT9138110.1 Trigger factor [Bacillota bacterium]MBT9146739.1 Trigger factor [Bacillota bacterium]RII00065.1 MAG: trigger factor [candidate division NPL-UPA2 bacterium Unc8]